MPEWAVQRRFTRFPIVLPVLHRLKGPGTVRTGVGWTRDLSGGGACVQLAEQLPPQVPLNLRLQTDRGAIELEGEVAWVGDPPKAGGGILHGVAFTHIAPDQLQTLRELIISKGKVRNAGGVREFRVAHTRIECEFDRSALLGGKFAQSVQDPVTLLA